MSRHSDASPLAPSRRSVIASGAAGAGIMLTRTGGAAGVGGALWTSVASGCAAAPMTAGASRDAPSAVAPPLSAACRSAYIYGLAVLEMARARSRTIGPEANRLRHARALAGPASRRVTTPNNDTLYSSAWLDLSRGPVEIAYPAAGQRYMSLAFMDMCSNNFLVLGPGETRGEAGVVRLAGPGAGGQRGVVSAPTPWVWFQARTLVAGPHDLNGAHRLQDGLSIQGPEAPAPAAPPADTSARGELAAVLALLETEVPARPGEARLRARWARAGLTRAALDPGAGALSPGFAQSLEAGVAQARHDISMRLAAVRPVSGWIYPEPHLGDFGSDYLYRAAVATWGLAALPVREAAYLRAVDAEGRTSFSPDAAYTLHFQPGRDPPARAFWSLSLYEVMDDGQLFFAENPINRYAIGDRTPGLLRAQDGSLTVRIGSQDPGADQRANWLPAPQRRFALLLRAYRPGADLISGRYRLPPVIRS